MGLIRYSAYRGFTRTTQILILSFLPKSGEELKEGLILIGEGWAEPQFPGFVKSGHPDPIFRVPSPIYGEGILCSASMATNSLTEIGEG